MFGFLSFYSILLLFLAVDFCIIYGQNKRKPKERYFNFASILLLLFATCRGESVGGDLESYIPLFQNSADSSSFTEVFQTALITGYEVGFVLLCKVISLFSHDSRWFIVVTSCISLFGPLFFINKYSNNKGLSLLLYLLLAFYNVSYNNIRQSVAISIVLISVHFLINRKKTLFFLGIALATTMHTSAVFTVFFFLFYRLRYSLSRAIGLIVGGGLTFVLLGSLLYQYILSNFFVKYLENGESEMSGTGFGMLTVYLFVALVCLFLFERVRNNFNDEEFLVEKILLYSVIFTVLIQAFATYMANITRLTYYFYILVIVLLPNILVNVKYVSTKRTLSAILFLLFYILACNTFLSPVEGLEKNSTDTIPYVFLNGLFSW